MQNVFTVLKKVPLYLADIDHSLEDRKNGETKIITLTCELALDAKLASAFDEDQILRRSLFRLNTPEPVGYIKSATLRVPFKRQRLEIFTTIDTAKATILIDQVLVGDPRVRVDKKSQLYTLILKFSFGPASKTELEFCEQWRTQTKAVTFTEAEPSLDFDVDDEDHEHEPAAAGRPAPMFDDSRDDKPAEDQRAIEAAAQPETETEPDKARRLPLRRGDKPGPRRVH